MHENLSIYNKIKMQQRSRSLQSSLKRTRFGSRSSNKSVRFADWEGASLIKVRNLSADDVREITPKPSTSEDGEIQIRLFSSRFSYYLIN